MTYQLIYFVLLEIFMKSTFEVLPPEQTRFQCITKQIIFFLRLAEQTFS